MIFGLPEVDIKKDSPSLRWVVSDPSTKHIILRLSFSYLFLWESLLSSNNAEDLFSVMEAALAVSGWPTDEELMRLERANPGVTSKKPFLDPSLVDSVRRDWIVSERGEKKAKAAKAKKKTGRDLFGKRKFVL